ncbi:hypothetical protein ABL78_2366 [Leptomonas seymouri]|uniref:Uncharacterized protein n=1 Tax=Leptomonas seymouri TaxID=5684 RepID=A0A0N1PEG5_LEPSE|nr:hypothetical protein ABL78_2366 [Leptomonas seymouri]|eukprot:KPI88554.1 hypothetical protein ABL78_2366 [Leptomonas seymouri]
MDAANQGKIRVLRQGGMRTELLSLPTAELLHRYNDANDLAHFLMDLIAQHQRCTIADVYALLDIAAQEDRK